MSFSLCTVACRGTPKEKSRSGCKLEPGRDAFAIHGRSGAQVALLQSPIPRTADKNYEINLESQLKTAYITAHQGG